MKLLTVQQVANRANMSKSGMWKRIRHTSNFSKYMTTDTKTKARLISPKGVSILLSKGDNHKGRGINVPSSVYYSMMMNNQRQAEEIQHLTRLLGHQQKIAESAQKEAHQLKLNPPKRHGFLYKLFH